MVRMERCHARVNITLDVITVNVRALRSAATILALLQITRGSTQISHSDWRVAVARASMGGPPSPLPGLRSFAASARQAAWARQPPHGSWSEGTACLAVA